MIGNEWIAASEMTAANKYVAEFYLKYPCKPSRENQRQKKWRKRAKARN